VPLTTLPPQIPVDLGLTVVDVNATWARLMWRKFTEFELQFIDGVQLRYKEKDGKVMIYFNFCVSMHHYIWVY